MVVMCTRLFILDIVASFEVRLLATSQLFLSRLKMFALFIFQFVRTEQSWNNTEMRQADKQQTSRTAFFPFSAKSSVMCCCCFLLFTFFTLQADKRARPAYRLFCLFFCFFSIVLLFAFVFSSQEVWLTWWLVVNLCVLYLVSLFHHIPRSHHWTWRVQCYYYQQTCMMAKIM